MKPISSFCAVFRVVDSAVILGMAFMGLMTTMVWAVDPPHWGETTDCGSCHTFHHAEGAALTPFASNANLCQSCHNAAGDAKNKPVNSADMAIPGSSGLHHAWEVNAANATLGTQAPLDSEMALRIMDLKIVCSTCHDQHGALIDTPTTSGTPHIGQPERTVDNLGTGSIVSSGIYVGTEGIRYLILIESAGSDTSAVYRWSKDGGITWMATGVSATQTPAALDFGVEISFSGLAADAFRVGEEFQFYGAYPFLRALPDSGDNVTGDKFCRDCHRDWVMDHDDADGDGKSTRVYDGTKKSHPVGVTLAAAYDRAQPLDGNGQAQNAAAPFDVDGNPSNDLKLGSGGEVSCLTCHDVHYADGNTLTGAP